MCYYTRVGYCPFPPSKATEAPMGFICTRPVVFDAELHNEFGGFEVHTKNATKPTRVTGQSSPPFELHQSRFTTTALWIAPAYQQRHQAASCRPLVCLVIYSRNRAQEADDERRNTARSSARSYCCCLQKSAPPMVVHR